MKITCPSCKGTGLQLPLCDKTCELCHGAATIEKAMKPTKKLKPLPANDDGALVQQLLDRDSLSEWETNFTISIEQQVRAGRALTEKQVEKAEEILER